jgi:hypothetical protein
MGLVAGLFLHDGSPMVIHHRTGGTSNPSTMCNLLRASTKPLAATIMANKNRMIWEGKEVAYNQMKKDYLEACKQPLPGNDVVNRPPEDIEQPPVPLRLRVGTNSGG